MSDHHILFLLEVLLAWIEGLWTWKPRVEIRVSDKCRTITCETILDILLTLFHTWRPSPGPSNHIHTHIPPSDNPWPPPTSATVQYFLCLCTAPSISTIDTGLISFLQQGPNRDKRLNPTCINMCKKAYNLVDSSIEQFKSSSAKHQHHDWIARTICVEVVQPMPTHHTLMYSSHVLSSFRHFRQGHADLDDTHSCI